MDIVHQQCMIQVLLPSQSYIQLQQNSLVGDTSLPNYVSTTTLSFCIMPSWKSNWLCFIYFAYSGDESPGKSRNDFTEICSTCLKLSTYVNSLELLGSLFLLLLFCCCCYCCWPHAQCKYVCLYRSGSGLWCTLPTDVDGQTTTLAISIGKPCLQSSQ